MPDLVEFGNRLKAAVASADLAFWAEIATAFPEATTGDFPPEATFEWTEARDLAVLRWILFNHPDGDWVQALINKAYPPGVSPE